MRDNDTILLESLYSNLIQENSNLDEWLNWFKSKDIANLPVSWSGVETNKGSMSYGGNVTINKIMRDAKAKYDANPQNVLNQLSSTLQDYIIGLQEDKKVIDQNTASQLIATFQDLNNVKYFFDNYQLSKRPIASIPQERPEDFRAVGDDEEKELEDYTNAYFDPNSNLYNMLRDDKFLHELQTEDPRFYSVLMQKIEKRVGERRSDDMKNMLIRMKREQGLPEQGSGTPEEQEYLKNKTAYVKRFQGRPPEEWDLKTLKTYMEWDELEQRGKGNTLTPEENKLRDDMVKEYRNKGGKVRDMETWDLETIQKWLEFENLENLSKNINGAKMKRYEF